MQPYVAATLLLAQHSQSKSIAVRCAALQAQLDFVRCLRLEPVQNIPHQQRLSMRSAQRLKVADGAQAASKLLLITEWQASSAQSQNLAPSAEGGSAVGAAAAAPAAAAADGVRDLRVQLRQRRDAAEIWLLAFSAAEEMLQRLQTGGLPAQKGSRSVRLTTCASVVTSASLQQVLSTLCISLGA